MSSGQGKEETYDPKKVSDPAASAPMEVPAARPLVPIVQQPVNNPVADFLAINDTYYKVLSKEQREKVKKYISTIKYALRFRGVTIDGIDGFEDSVTVSDDEDYEEDYEYVDFSLLSGSESDSGKKSGSDSASSTDNPLDYVAYLPKLCDDLLTICQTYQGKLFWKSSKQKLDPLINIVRSLNDRVQASKGYLGAAVTQTKAPISTLLFDPEKTETFGSEDFVVLSGSEATFADLMVQQGNPLFNLGVFQKLSKDGNMDKLFEFSEALTDMTQNKDDKNKKLIMWVLVISCLDIKQTLCKYGLNTYTLATRWLNNIKEIEGLHDILPLLNRMNNYFDSSDDIRLKDDKISDSITTMLDNSGYVDYTAFLKGNVLENIQSFIKYAWSVYYLYICEVEQEKDLKDFKDQQILFNAIIAGANLRMHGIIIDGDGSNASTETRPDKDKNPITPLTPFGGDPTQKINSIIGNLRKGINKNGIKHYSVKEAFYEAEKASRDPQHPIAQGSDYETAAEEDHAKITSLLDQKAIKQRILELAQSHPDYVSATQFDNPDHDFDDTASNDSDFVLDRLKKDPTIIAQANQYALADSQAAQAAQAAQAVETTKLANALESIFFDEFHDEEFRDFIASPTFSEDNTSFDDIWSMIPKVGVEVTFAEFSRLFDDNFKNLEKAKVVDKFIEKAYDMCLPIVVALGTAPFKYRLDDRIPNISLLAQDFSFIDVCLSLYDKYPNIDQLNKFKISALLYVINARNLYKNKDYKVDIKDWRQIYANLKITGIELQDKTFDATLLDFHMQDVNDLLINKAKIHETSVFSPAIYRPLPNIDVRKYVSQDSQDSMFSFSDLVYTVLNLGPFKTISEKDKIKLIQDIWKLVKSINGSTITLEQVKNTFSPKTASLKFIGETPPLQNPLSVAIQEETVETYTSAIKFMKEMLLPYFENLNKKIIRKFGTLDKYKPCDEVPKSEMQEAVELATFFKNADFSSDAKEQQLMLYIYSFESITIPETPAESEDAKNPNTKVPAVSPSPSPVVSTASLPKVTQPSPINLDGLIVKGICNKGNYCYLISTLQILFRIPIIQQTLNTYADSTSLNTLKTNYETALKTYKAAKEDTAYTQADKESKTVSNALTAAREGARILNMDLDNNEDSITIQSIIAGLISKLSKATSGDSAAEITKKINRLQDILKPLIVFAQTQTPTIQSLIDYSTPKNARIETLNKNINAEFFRNKKPYVIALLKKIYDDFNNQKSTFPINSPNIAALAKVLFPDSPAAQQDIDDCFQELFKILEIPDSYDPFHFSIDKMRTQPNKKPETTSTSEGSISLNIDTFVDDQNNPLALQDLVDEYFSAQLTSTDKEFSPDDKTTKTATSSPNILRISIKRFTYSHDGSRTKLTHKITAPDTLLLPVKDSASGVNYDLYAFQIHLNNTSPTSTNYGHYISYINDGKQWYCFNDSSALPAEESTVKDDLQQAYVLYYKKEGAPATMPAVSPIIPEASSGTLSPAASSTSSSASSSRGSSPERPKPLLLVAKPSVFPLKSSASVPPITSDPVGVGTSSAMSTPGVSETTPHKTKLKKLIEHKHFEKSGTIAAEQIAKNDDVAAKQTILACVQIIKRYPPSEDEVESREMQAEALTTLMISFCGGTDKINKSFIYEPSRVISANGLAHFLDEDENQLTNILFYLKAFTLDNVTMGKKTQPLADGSLSKDDEVILASQSNAYQNIDLFNEYFLVKTNPIIQKFLYCFDHNINFINTFTPQELAFISQSAGFYYNWYNTLKALDEKLPEEQKKFKTEINAIDFLAALSRFIRVINSLAVLNSQEFSSNNVDKFTMNFANYIQQFNALLMVKPLIENLKLPSFAYDSTDAISCDFKSFNPADLLSFKKNCISLILSLYPKLITYLFAAFYSLKENVLMELELQKDLFPLLGENPSFNDLHPQCIAVIITMLPKNEKNKVITGLSQDTIDSAIEYFRNIITSLYPSAQEQAQAVVDMPEDIRQKILPTLPEDAYALFVANLPENIMQKILPTLSKELQTLVVVNLQENIRQKILPTLPKEIQISVAKKLLELASKSKGSKGGK